MKNQDLEKQFETKYNDYGKILYQIAFLYMRNSADAEDVLQEVFMKYLSGKYFFRDSEHEKAWFIRVTQNKCLDLLKRAERKNIPFEDMTTATYDCDGDNTDVLQKVMALPENYKTCVILYYYNDYSVSEIAKTLRISKSAVKMRLKRSREMLKIELEESL